MKEDVHHVLVRFMRMLTGTGIVALTGEDTYSHTQKSLAYLQSSALDFFNLCTNMMTAYLSFPAYFTSHTSSDLEDLRKTPCKSLPVYASSPKPF